MTLSSILSLLLAIFKAIPVAKQVFDDLVQLYVATQIENMRKENREAMRKAIEEQDQRDLERAIGSPRAGKPSDLPGAIVVDDLPGVLQNTKPD